jgi:fructose-1,6-bisphosphatase
MKSINSEDAFRLWVRSMLEQMLGDEPSNVRYVASLVTDFFTNIFSRVQ